MRPWEFTKKIVNSMISTLPLAFEVVLINRRPNGRRRFTALCTHNKITWNWLTIKAVFSNNPTSCIAFFADFPKGWRLISRNICQNQNHFFQINTAQHFFFFRQIVTSYNSRTRNVLLSFLVVPDSICLWQYFLKELVSLHYCSCSLPISRNISEWISI